MAILTDTNRPLRRPLELQRLAQAVLTADPADETWWIEWKSDLDLTKAAGAFKVAKAILAFANRMPDYAATACGGLAYFLLGVEPNKLTGTPPIDGANLESYLIKYLGSDGPSWSPTNLEVNGENVLVVVVEPPRWGDPIFTLRETYGERGGAMKGTIFVRSQATSRPAYPEDITQLSKRLTQGTAQPELAGLSLDYELGDLPGLITIDTSESELEELLDALRGAAYEAAESEGLAMRGARRDDFDTQIEKYLTECRARASGALQRLFMEGGLGLISFKITNHTSSVLEDVELILRPAFPHAAWDKTDHTRDLAAMPAPPKAPKRESAIGGFRLPSMAASLGSPLRIPEIPDQFIDIGPEEIALTIGRVRPTRPETSTRFYLFLTEHLPASQAEIHWLLNSPSASGSLEGTLEIPINPRKVGLLTAFGSNEATGATD